jgi:hypothetical protein
MPEARNPAAAQVFRRGLTAAEGGGLQRELVGMGEPLGPVDRQALCDHRLGQRAGHGDHLRGVGPPEIAPVEHGDGQRRRFRGVEIGGHAGEGDGVEPSASPASLVTISPPAGPPRLL